MSNMGTYLAVMYLVWLPLMAFIFVAQIMVIRKAGEPWWKGIIPGYNVYVIFKVARLRKPLMHAIVYGVLISVAMSVAMSAAVLKTLSQYGLAKSGASGFLSSPGGIFLMELPALVLTSIAWFKMGRAFGKGTGFNLGLVFLSFIFVPILGFGKSQYLYKSEEAAVLQVECTESAGQLEDKSKAVTAAAEMKAAEENRGPVVCPSCGAVLEKANRFCPKCGAPLN